MQMAESTTTTPKARLPDFSPTAKTGRPGGWDRARWRLFLDKLMPGLPMKQRLPIISKICHIQSAIFHRLNSGKNLASEAVQRRAELAELCLSVAEGKPAAALKPQALRLLADRESQMVLVAYHVTKDLVNEEIRNQAARSILLGDIKLAQATVAHED